MISKIYRDAQIIESVLAQKQPSQAFLSFLQQKLFELEKEFDVNLTIVKNVVYDQHNKKLYTISANDSIDKVVKIVKRKLKE